jgi:hypothetical protein
MTLRVNNEAGVARVAQQYVWFNRNMADVQILEADTTTADGVRHDVQPEQIRDVQEARSFDAPMFQDIQEKVIVFPAVEQGAREHLTYRKTQKQPIAPSITMTRDGPTHFASEVCTPGGLRADASRAPSDRARCACGGDRQVDVGGAVERGVTSALNACTPARSPQPLHSRQDRCRDAHI